MVEQSHRRTKPRHSGKVRAVLSVGMILGLAQVGTLAAWTDTAVIESQTFETGRLDIAVGESAAGNLKNEVGGTWNHATLAADNLNPGEAIARELTIGNTGSVPISVNGTLAATTNDLGGFLKVTLVQGGTVGNGGTAAANNRTGTCTGGTATAVTSAGVTTTAVNVHNAASQMAVGATRKYCVRVQLDTGATNGVQGKSTKLRFTFNADQVAP